MFDKDSPTYRWYGGNMGASIVLPHEMCPGGCNDLSQPYIANTTDGSVEEGEANVSNLELDDREQCGAPHSITFPVFGEDGHGHFTGHTSI